MFTLIWLSDVLWSRSTMVSTWNEATRSLSFILGNLRKCFKDSLGILSIYENISISTLNSFTIIDPLFFLHPLYIYPSVSFYKHKYKMDDVLEHNMYHYILYSDIQIHSIFQN